MKAETVVYTLLTASSAIAGVVGTRIYLDNRPEADPLPAIVYGMVSDKPDGARPIDPEMMTARMQINCLGLNADPLVTLRDLVRQALNNQSGVIGGVSVVACIQDSAGPDSFDETTITYVKPIDFIVHYLR